MKTIFLAGALALASGAASAATLTFDLLGSYATNQSSLGYSAGGVDLTVTGSYCGTHSGPNSQSCQDAAIDQFGTGIGLYRGGLDSHQVDGFYRNEFLQLAFGEDITLESVSFTYYSSNDDFQLYTWSGSDWSHVGQGDACESNCGSSSTIQTYDFLGTYTGSNFVIGATGDNDDWKLRAVTVDYTPPVVPLPAAGWMLLAGIGGLLGMKRRKAA